MNDCQEAASRQYDALPPEARKIAAHLDDAINTGTIAEVRALLDSGAGANRRDRNGDTYLHIAAYVGATDIAQMLLEYGADRSALDCHGRTAREIALLNEHDDTAALLEAR